MLTKEDLKLMRANSARGMSEAIRRELLKLSYNKGKSTKRKLISALKLGGYEDLLGRTLLCDEVHQKHSRRIDEKFKDRLNRYKALHAGSMKSLSEIAASHIRFVTVLDSVVPVDASEATRRITRFKEDLRKYVGCVSGIWCLGVVEVEVVPLKLMSNLFKQARINGSEKRKFDVCEIMKDEYKDTLFAKEDSYFLIHFHGVAFAGSADKFELMRQQLNMNMYWRRADRQVEIKQLSQKFEGKPKSVERNLSDIAKYITKGGMDMFAGRRYFRYKLSFSYAEDGIGSEDEWMERKWRDDEELKRIRQVEGIEDRQSMLPYEIIELAKVVDGMMGMNRTRTGYQLAIGK